MKVLGLFEVSEETAHTMLNVSVAIILLYLVNWLLKRFFNIDVFGGIRAMFGGGDEEPIL